MKVKTSDGLVVELPQCLVQMSGTIKDMNDDMDGIKQDPDQVIDLSLICSRHLAKICEFCQWHTDHPTDPASIPKNARKSYIDEWDTQFCNMPINERFELIESVSFFHIQSMYDTLCKSIAGMLEGKRVSEMLEIVKPLGIYDDFTPEEREQNRKDIAWCDADASSSGVKC
jgi:S-phase kinase-associated protein 1